DDRFEIYYNYLNRMPPKTDDIGDKSIAESPPNTCSDISKDSSPRKRRGKSLSFFVVTPFRRKRTGRNAGCSRERERSSAEGTPSGVSADSRRSLSFFVVTPFRRKRTGRNAGCSRA
ncbi:MAG TPA: hypothetical protein H9726_02700, partial [Candidatus Borkfalkia avicola]|nr:hypothetical protein [Candidatus Borkfalkia avicola]